MMATVKSLLVLSIYAANVLGTQAASLEHMPFFLNTHQADASNETDYSFPQWNISSSDNSALAKAPLAGTFYRGGPELADVNSPFHPVTGSGGWEWAVEKARSVVEQLTLEEKVNLTAGITGGRCEGTLGRVERFGIPELCFQDGPAGLRASDFVTVFPAGVTTAATWDRDLIYRRAAALGAEFVAKGVNVHLGPVTGGPLGRSPFQGRNWEGFGPDPYLHGEAAYYTVSGTQSAGVISTAKHFLAYEQETYRQLYAASDAYTLNPNNNTELTYSANLDDRTLHELYLWPFMNAVRAGSGAVMCVYNRINSTQGCENSKLLNTILKDELDFQGFVVTDWSAAFNTSNTYNGGSDVVMPGGMTGGYKNLVGGSDLVRALDAGQVKIERINDGITRLLAQWYLRGQHKGFPTVSYKDGYQNTIYNGSVVNEHRDVQADHWKIVREIGEAAVTLIYNKRSNQAGPQGSTAFGLGLPLNKKARIGIFGSDAGSNPYGINSCQNWIGLGSLLCPANATSNGTQAIGWGSGAGFFPYLIDPLGGISQVAKQNHGSVINNLNDVGDEYNQMLVKQAAGLSDAALVFVQARSGEDSDRQSLRLDADGDQLIRLVASQNNNTIVVVHTVGPILMSDWFDHVNITALVLPHLPGQESGNSLARVLYGDVNPSGKMPYSILADKHAQHYAKIVGSPASDPQVDFTEQLYIDYRAWDKMGIEPLIPFGHGISYTNYTYSNLNIRHSADNKYAPSAFKTNNDKQPGGSGSLFQYLVEVTADIQNVGGIRGDEVAQLYVGYPPAADAPIKQLRGFDRLKRLDPEGAPKTATFELTKRDFSVWDVTQQQFNIVDGEYKIWVGKSSHLNDLTLNGSVTIKNAKVVGMSF